MTKIVDVLISTWIILVDVLINNKFGVQIFTRLSYIRFFITEPFVIWQNMHLLEFR